MFPSTEQFEITPAELKQLLKPERASDFRLIDCREEDEFSICRIEGAELHPLSRFHTDATRLLLNPADERPLVIYCHHGMRSMNATRFLREKGKAEVWSLAGGIDLWSTLIDPGVPRY